MSSFISSFNSDVKAVLLTLLILGLADLALRLAEEKLSIDVQHIRSFPRIARELSAQPAPRFVFLGNSLTRYGVDPDAWASALKELGAPKGAMAKLVPDDTTIPDWYYVALNTLIRPGYPPEVLIVGFSLDQLTDERIEAPRLGAYFCNHRNVRELFTRDLDGLGAKCDFLLGWLSRLYGVRDQMQARFGEAFIPGYVEGVTHLNQILRRRHQTSIGKVRSYKLLDRALALWRAQGIEVVLVAIPIPSNYEIDPAVIRKAHAAGARFIDARNLPSLTREDFPDGYHMGSRAAKLYTRFVAERVANTLRANARPPGMTARAK